ncbi:hypothetical protein B0H14DRAFT_3584465 [Mycena olivaceomarginata]|nr:hypothetical protein B0H14DRAFT_3584465 [Mycena olivaceomarginata]
MSNINGQYSRCSGTWWDHTDRANLKACVLVCRTFLVPGQRCLFRFLKLGGRGTGLDGIPQSPTWPLDPLVDVGKWTPSAAQSFIPQLGMGWQIATLSLLRLQNLRCFGLRNCREVSISLVRLALASCREVSLSNARICQDPSPFLHMTRDEAHSTPSSVPLDRLTLDTYACFLDDSTPGLPQALFHKAPTSLQVDRKYLELIVQTQRPQNNFGTVDAYPICSSLRTFFIDFGAQSTLPGLRSLTLRAYLDMLHLSVIFCSTIIDLPARMPNIEKLTLVIDASF